jgi:hypothetical protein
MGWLQGTSESCIIEWKITVFLTFLNMDFFIFLKVSIAYW